MKKIGFLILAFAVTTYTASAQSYLRVGLGYAMPEAGQTLDGTGQPYNGTSNNGAINETIAIKAASYSSGVHGHLAAGYMFSEHVGAELASGEGYRWTLSRSGFFLKKSGTFC